MLFSLVAFALLMHGWAVPVWTCRDWYVQIKNKKLFQTIENILALPYTAIQLMFYLSWYLLAKKRFV